MKKVKPIEIIKNKLYAFHYEKDDENILSVLLSRWNDIEYLFKFFQKNNKFFLNSNFFPIGYSIEDFTEDIEWGLEKLENILEKLKNTDLEPDSCFEPLSKEDSLVKVLSLRKGKSKLLRIYAIKIDEGLYVITGGAIKITQKMQDHKDTKNELAKMRYAKEYLKNINIKTEEAFYCYFNIS